MSCGGCASAVSRAITNLDPAAKVEIDVAAKTGKVGSALKQGQIASAIEAAGIHPTATTS
ncbi:heavy-metal-associated domain-containing protein [Paraburkholderia sp. LEh10]|nr:heavy-metal-associated domain-containing protein [Paraburkholderia sp. LEh10]